MKGERDGEVGGKNIRGPERDVEPDGRYEGFVVGSIAFSIVVAIARMNRNVRKFDGE